FFVRASRWILGAVAVAAFGAAQGCAEERDPINRVQAGAVPKSIFVRPDGKGQYLDDSDSWYFRATITDVPAAQNMAFIGAAGDMYRIKWKIDETVLIAYREDPDILGTTEDKGGVIAAFPILSHFDIKHAYNANTGEELNLIEENTTDRPWAQREYIRVDWS